MQTEAGLGMVCRVTEANYLGSSILQEQDWMLLVPSHHKRGLKLLMPMDKEQVI